MDNLSVYSSPESNFDYFSLPVEELPQAEKKAKIEALNCLMRFVIRL